MEHERLDFSRGFAIKAEYRVFYQCIEGSHREANFNRPSLPNVLPFPDEVARTLPHMLLDCHDDSASLFNVYLQCVAKYTSRSLSRATDGLNAFQGVLSHLERHFGSSIVAYMAYPEAQHDISAS